MKPRRHERVYQVALRRVFPRGGIAVALEARRALLADFKEFLPTLEHVAWEPTEGASSQADAMASYGMPIAVAPRVGKAKVILSFGADFLNGEDPQAIAGFAAGRRPPNE